MLVNAEDNLSLWISSNEQKVWSVVHLWSLPLKLSACSSPTYSIKLTFKNFSNSWHTVKPLFQNIPQELQCIKMGATHTLPVEVTAKNGNCQIFQLQFQLALNKSLLQVLDVIQRCKSKILRATVDAPWYFTNDMIHKDIGIPTVHEVIHDRSIKHDTKIESHSNLLLQPLPHDDAIQRLKGWWPADLLCCEWDPLAKGDLIMPVSLHDRLPASPLAYIILCTLIADWIKRDMWSVKKGLVKGKLEAEFIILIR